MRLYQFQIIQTQEIYEKNARTNKCKKTNAETNKEVEKKKGKNVQNFVGDENKTEN